MNKVAINCEGVVEVHAKGDGNYTSLCGVDGDEPPRSFTVPVPRGAKIDCGQCKTMWDWWRGFKRADFV